MPLSQRSVVSLSHTDREHFGAVDALIAAETCPTAIALLTLGYDILFSNRAFQQLFAASELAARPGANLLSVSAGRPPPDYLHALARNGSAPPRVLRIAGHSGQESDWWCDGRRIVGEAGTPKWLVLTFTELQRTELDLSLTAIGQAVTAAEGLDQFGTWIMTVPAGAHLMDADMHWSQGMSLLLQRIHMELKRPIRQWLETIHRQDRSQVAAQLSRLVTHGGEYMLDYRTVGSHKIVRSHGRALEPNAAGDVIISGIERDVTDAVRHARSEREHLYLQQALTDSYQSPAFVVDLKLRLRWFNSLFATLVHDLSGSDPDLGTNVGQVFRGRAMRRRILDNLRHGLLGERRIEELVVGSTARRLIYDLTYNPVRDDLGEIIGAAVVGVDVTARKLMESRMSQNADAGRGGRR